MGLALGIAAFVLFSASIPIVAAYWIDVRAHGGVDVFRRRRILRSGIAADATVLMDTLLMTHTGSRHRSAHSIVYEVRPPGQEPFRAKGIEVLYMSEAHAAGLAPNAHVRVRFDPADRTVVLVRVDPKQRLQDREADRKAREAALLRGG